MVALSATGLGSGLSFKLVGYGAVEIFKEDKGCDKDDKPAKGDIELLSLYPSGEHRSNNGTDGGSHNCQQDDSEIKGDIGVERDKSFSIEFEHKASKCSKAFHDDDKK